MEISDIIVDSLKFPLNNIQSLIMYLVLGFILSLVLIFTVAGTILGGSGDVGAGIIIALVGIIISAVLIFAIEGYALDIIKSGINRNMNGPSVDFVRQTVNGIKAFIVQLVYFIIPTIIILISTVIFSEWIVILITLILYILFGLVATMGQCRLAKTEDLGYSLNVTDAIEDLKKIGIVKVLVTIAIVIVVTLIITSIISLVFGLISQNLVNIINGLVSVYILFFTNRASGLLYSEL